MDIHGDRKVTCYNKRKQGNNFTFRFLISSNLLITIWSIQYYNIYRAIELFHSDWDNLDQLVSDVYGAGSVHTAVGIYLHDLGFCTNAEAPTPMTQDCHIDTQPQKKQRAFKSTVQELPFYYEWKRSEPALLASSSSDMTTSIHED